ncbi:MAG: cupin domain-containing protein [Halioglobus sp.]
MRALLTEFQRESEHQSQAVGADIFIGNYKATPFGVHKDNLHNFMFMSLGRRIMHFWPDREGEKSADESRKVSFEVEPGDLLYWPPEYWHVGESTGETAVSMNIDIWENTSSQWSKKSVIDALSASADPITELLANRSLLNKGGNEYPRNGDEPNQGAHYLQRIAKKVVAALDGPMLELSLSKAWLARISSAAMDVAVPRRTFAGISPGEHYQICDCTSLPSLSCSGKYLLACNGHVITKPDLTGWDKIRATICSGEPFTANQLAATDGSISTTDACDFLQELYECCGIRPVAGVICSPVSQ